MNDPGNAGEEKIFDLSLLEEISDADFMVEVIGLYLHDTGEGLENMKHALDAGSLDTVYKTAHKLKSSTGMFQANTLFTILDKTEKNEGEITQLNELLETARNEFDLLKIALELHLKVLQQAA